MRQFFFLSASLLALTALSAARADESRRLFDFAPVCAANPVVARIDRAIEIPLSEVRSYKSAERLRAACVTLEEKRTIVNELIDEYLLVDEAYRRRVHQSSGFVKQMEATRTMILADFMATQAYHAARAAITAAASTAPSARAPAEQAASAMADRLFDQAQIDISNEAFALVKRAAKAIDAATTAASRGPVFDSKEAVVAKVRAILDAAPDVTVVRYEGKLIKSRSLLAIYAGLPEPRPDVQSEPGFVEFIKPLITPELMAMEAVKQGIERDRLFQQKLLQNENTLLRFHMQGAIEHEANAVMNAPVWEEQVRAWYDQHRADYAMPTSTGETRPATYEEAKARAVADCSVALIERLKAEKVTALRGRCAIDIDESVLAAF